jgi:hypothetical protein
MKETVRSGWRERQVEFVKSFTSSPVGFKKSGDWRNPAANRVKFRFSVFNFAYNFPPMTEVQQQMIDKAFELLSEHFDHVVIAVGTYDEDKQYTTTASYYGGVAPAIGLCKLYEKRWTKEHLWGPDDEME